MDAAGTPTQIYDVAKRECLGSGDLTPAPIRKSKSEKEGSEGCCTVVEVVDCLSVTDSDAALSRPSGLFRKAACKVRAPARPGPTHPWRLTARKPSPTSAGKTERVRSAVASVRVRAE